MLAAHLRFALRTHKSLVASLFVLLFIIVTVAVGVLATRSGDRDTDTFFKSTSASELCPLVLLPGDGLRGIWTGRFATLESNVTAPPPRVSLVIAFCDESLKWLGAYILDHDVVSITIYSKCGKLVERETLDLRNESTHPPALEIISLPNVGRVDHAFAFHVSNLKLTDDLDVVHVFMKDTHMDNHHDGLDTRSLGETIHDATGPAGYACGRLPGIIVKKRVRRFGIAQKFNVGLSSAWSFWHDSHSIKQFRLSSYSSHTPRTPNDKVPFKGSVATFEQWWHVLETPIPGPIMPVCFGGFFAAKAANLRAGRAVYTKMVKALERGDNTLEGHFAERSHAAILLPAIPHHMVKTIQERAVGHWSCEDNIGYCGALQD